MEKRGIDVSYHNGIIDWNKVKKAGIEFAIIRIGYGMYENQKDTQFETNYTNARANGIPVGVYLYSYAKTVAEAKREAEVTLKWLNDRDLQLPVYFDLEDRTQQNLSKSVLDGMCEAFCDTIENGGYWAGIYTNKYWATSIIDGPELGKRYTYWVAQYNDKCTYTGPYAMWQYSSSGKVDGIRGNVDMNILYQNLGGKKSSGNSTGPISTKKSNETIAQEIIDGKWGNGDERKTRLANAGYDYKVIQALVNQKLKNTPTVNYYNRYAGNSVSIVDALKAIGVNNSFDNRAAIAKKNGINNYSGSASQNNTLLKLLKEGKLKK